jgi:hypothetical protein
MAKIEKLKMGTDNSRSKKSVILRRRFATLFFVEKEFKNQRAFAQLRVSIVLFLIIVIAALASVGVVVSGIFRTEQLPAEGPLVTLPGPTPYIRSVEPTNRWVNFYSLQSTLDGQSLPVGAVITALDPDGVVCGEFLVTQAGRYGLMPVYGDDPYSLTDEGAVPGDLLEFRINGIKASVTGPDEALWTTMGDLNQLDLAASTPSQFTP